MEMGKLPEKDLNSSETLRSPWSVAASASRTPTNASHSLPWTWSDTEEHYGIRLLRWVDWWTSREVQVTLRAKLPPFGALPEVVCTWLKWPRQIGRGICVRLKYVYTAVCWQGGVPGYEGTPHALVTVIWISSRSGSDRGCSSLQ